MSVLFSLSKYQLIAFLTEWCNLKQIALIDSSICNKEFRRQFLLLLKSITFKGYNTKSIFFPIWIWLRGINLKQIFIWHSNITSCYNYSVIQVFNCENNCVPDEQLLMKCQCYHTFRINCFKFWLSDFDSSIFKQVHSLHLHLLHTIKNGIINVLKRKDIKFLSDSFGNLKYLSLEGPCDTDVKSICTLLVNNPNLSKITLKLHNNSVFYDNDYGFLDLTLIECIACHFPQLTTFKVVYMEGKFDIYFCCQIIDKHPLINMFSLMFIDGSAVLYKRLDEDEEYDPTITLTNFVSADSWEPLSKLTECFEKCELEVRFILVRCTLSDKDKTAVKEYKEKWFEEEDDDNDDDDE